MAFPGKPNSFSMVNGGYYPLAVDPGAFEVLAMGTDGKFSHYSATVKSGDELYVRVAFADTLAVLVPAEFREVDKARGSEEIRKRSLISERD
jgi:hypothetical protein